MDKIRFLIYYLNLRLTTAIGLHQTYNPLDMEWRWRHWQQIKATRRKQKMRDDFQV